MDELQQALEEFVDQRRGRGVIPATVTAVDSVNMVFDCEDGDGNPYVDVRINATTGEDGVLVMPRVDSTVLIVDIGNRDQDYVLVQAGSIDQIHLNVAEATTVFITDESIDFGGSELMQPAVLGDSLNSNLHTLISQLDALVTHLQTFTTTQSAAAAGVLAPLVPAYTALNAQLPAIKTQLTTLQQQLDNQLSGIVNIAP